MAYIATIGARTMTNGVTTVDCQKQVRSWRLLRSLMELLIPTCNCTFIEENHTKSEKCLQNYNMNNSATITGTILGYRRGKALFCIQANANSTNPILLLELAIPTSVLAKEMRGGTLRIVLESSTTGSCNNLFSTPLWTMYCNGRKVGYAVKRRPSHGDFEVLNLMRSVDVGTGVINGKELNQEDELMYLRANFQRVRGSSNSNCESFHLIDPEGSIGQELSIFFFRSR
ncbi:Protein MIZU-KUSSEI 1-like, plant [Sesbania bispinosa]|nr:Protein MIZU-KUSSEI 1-like, plant [Sesbania bispinosa]